MKLVNCTRCASKELIEEDGLIVCVYCRSKYVPQPDDTPPRQSTIGLTSDIERLLQKCIDEPHNSRRYAALILDIDPTNQEARRFF